VADFNKVMLMGNLTRDPEVRYTPSGMAVADLGLAVNRTFKGSDGQMKDETCFVRVTVWARQAENCGQYLHKGSPVFVEGRLKYDEWEKDGQKQSRLSVVGERVQFLGAPRGAGSQDGSAGHEAVSGGGGTAPAVATQPTRTAPAPMPEELDGPEGDEDDLPF
jgi:single-strand DNA-binding protein